MPLSRWERKERLGFGGVKAMAEKLSVSPALVSLVVNGKAAETKVTRRVKVAIARRIGMPVAEVFGPTADDRGSSLHEGGRPAMEVGG